MLFKYSTYFIFPNKIFLTSTFIFFLLFHFCSVQKIKKSNEVVDGEEFIENIIAGEGKLNTTTNITFNRSFK